MKQAGGFTFFFRESDSFSNWYCSQFQIRGITFNCVEQYMMFYKAMLFGDEPTAQKIMQAAHPKQQKALGRQVSGYDDSKWIERRMKVVTHACVAKFSQNQELLEVLRMTADTTLVEASPYDRIWGVGLGENDPRILDPTQWQGQNLLGKALMEARSHLFAGVRSQVQKQSPIAKSGAPAAYQSFPSGPFM